MSSSTDTNWQVIVVGAGAAGLVAAERAANRGLKTLLLEKNPRPGVKILMSGGTRCNLTHNTDARGIVAAYGPPGRFLHSALAALGPRQLVGLVEAEGVATKIEETGKIFPVSNRATDILAAFMARLERTPCVLSLSEPVVRVKRGELSFEVTTARRTLTCENLILTVGGQSYPGSGTSGEGYAWARDLGHTIVPPRPALVPIVTATQWVTQLRGITVPDVALRVLAPPKHAEANPEKRRVLGSARGSLLFTHFGLSGPVALDVSRYVSGEEHPESLTLECDFAPNRRAGEVDEVIRQSIAENGKRQLASLLPDDLPRRLSEALVELIGASNESRAAELTREGRAKLVAAIKQTQIPIQGTRGFKSAEVTAGGVALNEIDSRTLQSKVVPGLYVAGELLDLDGPIGGFNFQAAFSTGWLAGMSV